METITEQEYLNDDQKLITIETTDCQIETETAAETKDCGKMETEGQGHVTGSPDVVLRKKSETSNADEILANGENPFFGEFGHIRSKSNL